MNQKKEEEASKQPEKGKEGAKGPADGAGAHKLVEGDERETGAVSL